MGRILVRIHFKIVYRKGSENARADAISRRADHEKDQDLPEYYPLLVNDQEGNLQGVRQLNITLRIGPSKHWKAQLQDWKEDSTILQGSPRAQRNGNTWLYNNKSYIPTKHRARLLQEFHSEQTYGYQGVTKTYERLRRYFDYPGIKKDVQNIIKKCEVCNRSKGSTHKPYGLLKPLPIPTKPC
jgi:hypothetical protein